MEGEGNILEVKFDIIDLTVAHRVKGRGNIVFNYDVGLICYNEVYEGM